uniref:Zinc finger family protein n=1 Tax=Rhizophora mucronata TaxID=61149 RepID=A0A2P2K9D6_RHIMU
MKGKEIGEVQLLEATAAAAVGPSDSDPLLENQADSSSPPATATPSPPPPLVSSSEINVEDAESGSIPSCRICLESDCETGDELISPCMCKGTHQFVHRSCLDHWRSVKVCINI